MELHQLHGNRGNTVRLTRNISATVPDPYVTWAPILPENIKNPFARQIKEDTREQTLVIDLVVLAMGLRPGRAFYEICVSNQVAPEVILLGDAFQIGVSLRRLDRVHWRDAVYKENDRKIISF